MENLNLNAQLRTKDERLNEIRNSKMIPSIVYWKKHESTLLKVDNSDFLRTFRKSWKSHIINLKYEWKNIEVLVHDIQKEPVTWSFLHVDFFALTKWEKVHTNISLKFVWESQAVKEWAFLEEHIKEIEVKVLPNNLVDYIEVDLSSLKEIWDTIKLSELNIDSTKIEVLTLDSVVVTAGKPAKIEVEEEIEAKTEEPDWESK